MVIYFSFGFTVHLWLCYNFFLMWCLLPLMCNVLLTIQALAAVVEYYWCWHINTCTMIVCCVSPDITVRCSVTIPRLQRDLDWQIFKPLLFLQIFLQFHLVSAFSCDHLCHFPFSFPSRCCWIYVVEFLILTPLRRLCGYTWHSLWKL